MAVATYKSQELLGPLLHNSRVGEPFTWNVTHPNCNKIGHHQGVGVVGSLKSTIFKECLMMLLVRGRCFGSRVE